MKPDEKTYVAQYKITPAPDGLDGFVATATGRSFHNGMFAIGDTPTIASEKLATLIGEALQSPAGKKRGWAPDRFDKVMLVLARMFEIAPPAAS